MSDSPQRKTDKEIWDALYGILNETMEFPSRPKPDENLIDFGLDDLDDVELIMSVEECFGIEIPEEDAMKLKTLQDYFTYLRDHGV